MSFGHCTQKVFRYELESRMLPAQQTATRPMMRQSSRVTGPACFSTCFSGWVNVGFVFAFSRGVETEEQILIRMIVSPSHYGLDTPLPLGL